MREYCMRGGKHIRGALAAATYDHLTGQMFSDKGITLAAAVELMHNYLLIIDDVMDQSPIRRGKKTVHELYRDEYPDASVFETDMMAINVGLLVQHISGLAVAELDGSAQLEKVMHRNIVITGLGQIDDMYQKIARATTPEEILAKYTKKSSFYTFVNPIECAYALAGRYDQAVHSACVRYGVPAGIAFQLHDDYLGVFGDSEVLGKANLDDIHEGKTTLLIIEALRLADKTDREALRHIIGNHQAGKEELLKTRAIIQSSGARDAVQATTHDLVEEAKKAATTCDVWDGDYGKFLVELVSYATERTS